jgi:lipopolysaccharide/colanic/teichoic acid biosynthesis glycosyltransferase
MDLLIVVPAVIVLSPVLLSIGVAIAIAIGRPVLFRQERPGLAGKPFTLVKFRTMNDRRAADGSLLPDSERLTPFGRWLRSTSLDELPELWNVLLGEMSLVGPRPLLMQYLPRYSKRQASRHEVPPGLTGWAQINGRNAISWDEKLEMAVWYAENWSLRLDIEILAATVGSVVSRHGITADGSATMPEFTGPSHSEDQKKSASSD